VFKHATGTVARQRPHYDETSIPYATAQNPHTSTRTRPWPPATSATPVHCGASSRASAVGGVCQHLRV